MQLPVFPAGAVEINDRSPKDAGVVWRRHSHLPLFHHGARDERSFRMFIRQMIVSGTVTRKAGHRRESPKMRWGRGPPHFVLGK